LFFPVILLFNGTSSQKTVNDLLGFVIAAITLWTLFQFFDKLKKWSVLWRTAVGFFISWVIYLAIALTILVNVLRPLTQNRSGPLVVVSLSNGTLSAQGVSSFLD
jgi:hypothetical protein